MPPSDEVVMKYLLAKHQPDLLWQVGVRFSPPTGKFEVTPPPALDRRLRLRLFALARGVRLWGRIFGFGVSWVWAVWLRRLAALGPNLWLRRLARGPGLASGSAIKTANVRNKTRGSRIIFEDQHPDFPRAVEDQSRGKPLEARNLLERLFVTDETWVRKPTSPTNFLTISSTWSSDGFLFIAQPDDFQAP